jgi:hypothetical protein
VFGKMQYIFESPTKEKFMTWKCQIFDSDSNILGHVTRQVPQSQFFTSAKTSQIWFEDTNGTKIGEIRKDKDGFAIYDQTNELRGIVGLIIGTSSGSAYLLDQMRKKIAKSDSFSCGNGGRYKDLRENSLGRVSRFEELREKGLNIWALDGSQVAIIHAAKTSPGCQIDIYPSNVSKLQVMSLVASIMFL